MTSLKDEMLAEGYWVEDEESDSAQLFQLLEEQEEVSLEQPLV